MEKLRVVSRPSVPLDVGFIERTHRDSLLLRHRSVSKDDEGEPRRQFNSFQRNRSARSLIVITVLPPTCPLLVSSLSLYLSLRSSILPTSFPLVANQSRPRAIFCSLLCRASKVRSAESGNFARRSISSRDSPRFADIR